MKWIPVTLLCFCLIHSGNSYWSKIMNLAKDFIGTNDCPQDDVHPDFEMLNKELNEKIFGQGIIIKALVPYVKSHYLMNPKKPLVISMNGWTGIGKNYVTSILIKHLSKNKEKSKFIQFYSGRIHFPKEGVQDVANYKVNLQQWVKGNVSACARSVFVFDEIDKMPNGVLDAIKPFLDYHEAIDGVDYRKAIFIFISNIGGGSINRHFKKLWSEGLSKEKLSFSDFEKVIKKNLYQSEGGLMASSILSGHLVSLYLPFLPLEIQDIEKCIKAEMTANGLEIIQENVDEILRKVDFENGLAISGCKRISEFVSVLLYKHIEL